MSELHARRAILIKFTRLVEEGGDWDRRNRLKVYSGLHLLSIRQFKPAAQLFIDALPTFTASELLEYKTFVSLTVIANTLVLKRVELKKKVGLMYLGFSLSHLEPYRLYHRQKSIRFYQRCQSFQTLPSLYITATTTSSSYLSVCDLNLFSMLCPIPIWIVPSRIGTKPSFAL